MIKCDVVGIGIALLLCIWVQVDNIVEAQGVFHLVIPQIIWTNLFWEFDVSNCTLKCTATFKLTCQQQPTKEEVCATIHNRHFCCHQQFITSSSTTTTTSTTTTSTSTTPSTTTSTEPSKLCESAEETAVRMCDPEPGCATSSNIATIHSYWKTPLRRSGGCTARCWEHCFDSCACKTAAGGRCEYQPANGLCRARNICEDALFGAKECRRASSFYSSAGFLCHQNKEERNCGGGNTVFAVNIAGGMHVDKRGIIYREDKDTIYEDKYNTKREHNPVVESIKDDDRQLYGSCVGGVSNGTDFGQCLQYAIPVDEDGDYELGIRTVEPDYDAAGERLFSLTLNDVLLVTHVDLYALSGIWRRPINIITKFTVETKGVRLNSRVTRRSRILTIKGLGPVIMPTNYVHVGFCTSECALCDEYSTIALVMWPQAFLSFGFPSRFKRRRLPSNKLKHT